MKESVVGHISQINNDDLNDIKNAVIDFIPKALKEGFHFTSKSVNSDATPVGVRIDVGDAKKSQYVTVMDSIKSDNGEITLLDYCSGAQASPMLNDFALLSIVERITVNEDGVVIGLDKPHSTKKKKSYAYMISKLFSNLQKDGLHLPAFDVISTYFCDEKELSFTEVLKGNFYVAHALMERAFNETDLESVLRHEVSQYINGAGSKGLDADVSPNLKTMLFPADADTRDEYISVTPLHSVPFGEAIHKTDMRLKILFGRKGDKDEQRALISKYMPSLKDDNGNIPDKTFNKLFYGSVTVSLPVGGANTQNVSAISRFAGLGNVIVSRPPFSDRNIKNIFGLAHSGYSIESSYRRSHIRELVSSMTDKLSLDFVIGSDGLKAKQIATRYASIIAEEVARNIDDIRHAIDVAGVDLSDIKLSSRMSWMPSLRDDNWYENIAREILDVERYRKEQSISNKMRKFILESLKKEMMS